MRGIFSHVVGDPKAESFPVRDLTVIFNAYHMSMAFSAARFARFVAALERLSDCLSSENYVNIGDDQILFETAVSDTFHLRIAFFRNRVFVVNVADTGPNGFEIDFSTSMLISGVGSDAKIVYVKDDTKISSILDWIGEASINIHEDGEFNSQSEPMLLDEHIERLTNFCAILDCHCQAAVVNSDGWFVKPSRGRQPQHEGSYHLVEWEADRYWRLAVACRNERLADWFIPLVYDLHSLRLCGDAFDGGFGASLKLAWTATVTGDRAVACRNERLADWLIPLVYDLHSLRLCGDAFDGGFGAGLRLAWTATVTGDRAIAGQNERLADWLMSRLIPFADDLYSVPQGDGVPRSVRPS